MTLLDAIRAADRGLLDSLPIRQRSWAPVLSIWYSPQRLKWLFEPGTDGEPGVLCAEPMQMCLTPETMVADDWEVGE